MIALTGGKTSIALVLFCERTRLLYETPAKVLEQRIEQFGKPRDLFSPHGNHFCALVFESWKTKFGRGMRNDSTKEIMADPF